MILKNYLDSKLTPILELDVFLLKLLIWAGKSFAHWEIEPAPKKITESFELAKSLIIDGSSS